MAPTNPLNATETQAARDLNHQLVRLTTIRSAYAGHVLHASTHLDVAAKENTRTPSVHLGKAAGMLLSIPETHMRDTAALLDVVARIRDLEFKAHAKEQVQ